MNSPNYVVSFSPILVAYYGFTTGAERQMIILYRGLFLTVARMDGWEEGTLQGASLSMVWVSTVNLHNWWMGLMAKQLEMLVIMPKNGT